MDDSKVIEKCQKGDGEAFRFLVERYQNQALAHAAAILRSRDAALDAVQEAFIDAFQSLKNFDSTRRFYPWFYVLLRNRCYKSAANAKRKMAETIEEFQILAPQANLAPEETLTLERALISLSDEDRELVTLKHLDGLSYEELAERLGIPKGTVMSRLFYARKHLRAQIERKI